MVKLQTMSFDAYRNLPGINSSLLKRFWLSAADGKHYIEHGIRVSTSMQRGLVGHDGILEPESFDQRLVVWDATRRGKDWELFRDHHADKWIVSESERDLAYGMIEAVIAHPFAHALLYGPGQSEAVIQWTDPQTGLACKARLDRFSPDPLYMVEVKTAASIEPPAFASQCSRLGYWLQTGFYADGLAALGFGVVPVFVVAVKNTPPHHVAVFELFEWELAHGRHQYAIALETYQTARKRREWPGPYDEKIETINVPNWDQIVTDEERETLKELGL